MRQSKKTPIALAILTLLAILIVPAVSDDDIEIQIATRTDLFPIPNLIFPAQGFVLFLAILALGVAAWSFYLTLSKNKKTPLFLVMVFGVSFVMSVLVWLFAGATMTITTLLAGSLALAVPLIFGSLSGALSERVGVINIAIEGQLLAGAFTSAVIASITDSVILGIISAMIAGSLVASILAVFSIKYLVDQIITGVVVNVLIIGLTSFLFSTLLADNITTLNQPPRFDKLSIPVLGQIPIIGPVLFNQTLIVYLMYAAVIGVFLALFKTKWGLRVRSVGEYPKASDTVGIKVFRTRYISVLIGGALAGLGGSFFTLGQVGAFGKEMTNGAGYIALAALIFGRWNPLYAAMAALLFGFALNLQYALQIVGSPLPSEFLLMLPYILTVIAVAGLVGKVKGPAAAGKPYIKS
jgi:simple sugar transport system permease protein